MLLQMNRHREQWQARKIQSEGKLRSLKKKVDTLDELVNIYILLSYLFGARSAVVLRGMGAWRDSMETQQSGLWIWTRGQK